MGKLYKNNGLKRHAITSYKEALQQMPTAIEVIEALLSLGVDSKEILLSVEEIRSRNHVYSTIFATNWMNNIVLALSSKHKADYKGSTC